MPDLVTYLCRARLDGHEFFFLWKDDSSVLVDDAGAIEAFNSEMAARERAALQPGLVATEPPAIYDFDRVSAWCASDDASVECAPLLNVWNILTDVPREKALFDEADARANDVYEKLVRGCNIPAITPPDEKFVPTWSSSELKALKRLLILGINDFRSRLSVS